MAIENVGDAMGLRATDLAGEVSADQVVGLPDQRVVRRHRADAEPPSQAVREAGLIEGRREGVWIYHATVRRESPTSHADYRRLRVADKAG